MTRYVITLRYPSPVPRFADMHVKRQVDAASVEDAIALLKLTAEEVKLIISIEPKDQP